MNKSLEDAINELAYAVAKEGNWSRHLSAEWARLTSIVLGTEIELSDEPGQSMSLINYFERRYEFNWSAKRPDVVQSYFTLLVEDLEEIKTALLVDPL